MAHCRNSPGCPSGPLGVEGRGPVRRGGRGLSTGRRAKAEPGARSLSPTRPLGVEGGGREARGWERAQHRGARAPGTRSTDP